MKKVLVCAVSMIVGSLPSTAQANITCGVAIMNGLAPNGITNNNKGMDAYWSTLRSGSASITAIDSQMSSFPGCH